MLIKCVNLWNLDKSHLNISLSIRVPSDSHKPHDLPQHKTEQLVREFVSFRCSKLVTRKQSDIILQCVAHRNLIHTCVNLMIIPIKIPLQIKMEQREKWRKNSSPQCWLRFDYYFTNVIIASYHVQNNNQPSKYQLVVVSAQNITKLLTCFVHRVPFQIRRHGMEISFFYPSPQVLTTFFLPIHRILKGCIGSDSQF